MLHISDSDLGFGATNVREAPAPLPFPRGLDRSLEPTARAEGEESEMLNDFEGPGGRVEPVDTGRIMATLTELEEGLADLQAEAEEIDDLLAPLNFSRFKAAWDDEGPWAA